MKARLKFTRKGWSKLLFSFRTGSVMAGTGEWVPYVGDGIVWPPIVEYWSTPRPTAADALAY